MHPPGSAGAPPSASLPNHADHGSRRPAARGVRRDPAASAAPGLVSAIHLALLGGTKELAERGGKAQAGVPHLQEAPAVEVQELPARRVQAVLPPPRPAEAASSPHATTPRQRSSRRHGAG